MHFYSPSYLHRYFRAIRVASYGGLRCSQIARGLDAGTGQQGEEPNPVACGELLAECWEKMLELVQNYELDLSRET